MESVFELGSAVPWQPPSVPQRLLGSCRIDFQPGWEASVMLTSLQLKPTPLQYPGTVPSLLKPLVSASALGHDLAPVIIQITKSLGFDNFMHGVSLSIHPNSESHSFVFTTLPIEWVMIYDQRAYLEADPRIQFGI